MDSVGGDAECDILEGGLGKIGGSCMGGFILLVPRGLGGMGDVLGRVSACADSGRGFMERRGGGRVGFGLSCCGSCCCCCSGADTNDKGDDASSLLSNDLDVNVSTRTDPDRVASSDVGCDRRRASRG